MAYALKGSCSQAAVHSKSAAHNKQATRLTRAVVKAHHTPAQAVKEAKAAVGTLAASISAAALLLVRPATVWRENSSPECYTRAKHKSDPDIECRPCLQMQFRHPACLRGIRLTSRSYRISLTSGDLFLACRYA